MNSTGSHPVQAKKSVEDWLVIIAITFFYLMILALTFFSAYWAFQFLP